MERFEYYMRDIRFFLRILRTSFFVFFDLAVDFIFQDSGPQENSKCYNYGIVFTSDIGDTVIFLQFLKVFLSRVDSSFIVITSEINSNLIKSFLHNAETLTLDYAEYRVNLRYRADKIKEIKSFEIGQVITPMRSRDYVITDSVSKVINKKSSIAFASDNSNRSNCESIIDRYIYDELISHFSSRMHELLAYEALLLRYDVNYKEELSKVIPDLRAEIREVEVVLPVGIPDKYFVLNIGASQEYKRWPIDKFILLAEKLYADYEIKSLFIGGPYEEALRGTFDAYSYIVDLISKTENFDVLKKLVSGAEAVISSDSFLGHYSVFLGVPTITIAGGGHFGRFHPYPTNDYTIYSNSCTVTYQMSCFNCAWECVQVKRMGENMAFPCVGESSIDDIYNNLLLIWQCKNRA